jgi:hypothetical protein
MLLWIPVVNLIALQVPLFYLFYKMMIYDVGLNISPKDEFKAILKENRLVLFSSILILFILSMIPYVAIFCQLFFVTFLSHIYINLVINYRSDNRVK